MRPEQKPNPERQNEIERFQQLYNAAARAPFTETAALDKYIGEAIDAAENKLRRGVRHREP